MLTNIDAKKCIARYYQQAMANFDNASGKYEKERYKLQMLTVANCLAFVLEAEQSAVQPIEGLTYYDAIAWLRDNGYVTALHASEKGVAG